MSSINLEKSMANLKKTYAGKDKDGNYILDKSLSEDYLVFAVSIHRVGLAIQNKEITAADFYKFLRSK